MGGGLVKNKAIEITAAILLAVSLLVSSGLQADEGTSDPDFDYLPPDEISIYAKMTSYVGSLFLARSHSGSYTTAKKRLYRSVQDAKTLYCGCKTKLAERTFDKTSCGYIPRNNNRRAKRLEAEHVLPAYWIAKFHKGKSCWVPNEDCGEARNCCLKNDKRFKKAHNDLVNLVPSIGELNADRSNLSYKLINGEVRRYGSCDFEVDRDNRITEPKNNIRGDIARVYFYMRDTYNLEFPTDLTERLTAWDEADPVSKEEKRRNKQIQAAQGSSNPLLNK